MPLIKNNCRFVRVMKKISSTFLRFTFVDVLDDASKRSCTIIKNKSPKWMKVLVDIS